MIGDISDIQFDGTFYVVPKLFYQLFTIFISIGTHQGYQSNSIQSNRSIFGQSTIQGRTIDYLVHNPIEIINP